jgi:hypothetical protein
VVRFIHDDPMGAWKQGDVAWDLGWESILSPGDPEFIPIRLLRLVRNGDVLALTDPFGRGMVEAV